MSHDSECSVEGGEAAQHSGGGMTSDTDDRGRSCGKRLLAC